MQIIKKERQLKEVVVENYSLCDKCNEKIQLESMYDAFTCKASLTTGSQYPGGGFGENQEIELCQECAVELIFLLASHGYRINRSEWAS